MRLYNTPLEYKDPLTNRRVYPSSPGATPSTIHQAQARCLRRHYYRPLEPFRLLLLLIPRLLDARDPSREYKGVDPCPCARSETLPQPRLRDDDDDYYVCAAVEARRVMVSMRGQKMRAGFSRADGVECAPHQACACGNARAQVFMELCRARLKRLGFIVLPFNEGLLIFVSFARFGRLFRKAR